MVLTPSRPSISTVFSPTPHSARAGRGSRNAAAVSSLTTTSPSGLAFRDASLARSLLGATPPPPPRRRGGGGPGDRGAPPVPADHQPVGLGLPRRQFGQKLVGSDPHRAAHPDLGPDLPANPFGDLFGGPEQQDSPGAVEECPLP